jgi:hypothetical protein
MYRVSQPAYVYLLLGVNRDLCSVCAHVALVGWRLPQASRFFRPRSLPRLGCVARGHGGIGVLRIVLMVLTFGWGVYDGAGRGCRYTQMRTDRWTDTIRSSHATWDRLYTGMVTRYRMQRGGSSAPRVPSEERAFTQRSPSGLPLPCASIRRRP